MHGNLEMEFVGRPPQNGLRIAPTNPGQSEPAVASTSEFFSSSHFGAFIGFFPWSGMEEVWLKNQWTCKAAATVIARILARDAKMQAGPSHNSSGLIRP